MTRAEEIAVIRAVKGRTCIYKEKLFIRSVIVADSRADDWGAKVSLEVQPMPGFKTEWRQNLTSSGAWEVLGVSDRAIGASYASWMLVTRPDLVQKITAFAATDPGDHALMKYVNRAAYSPEF